MDLEEMLNPKGKYGSGVLIHTDEEIVEALQGMNLDVDGTDCKDKGDKVPISCKEAHKYSPKFCF